MWACRVGGAKRLSRRLETKVIVMNEAPESKSESSPPSSGLPRSALVSLLIICVVAIGAVLALALRSNDQVPEVIIAAVEVESPAAVSLNVSEIIDTLVTPDVEAKEGRRYRVLVVDAAREGAAGIARIGGLVTFVPNTTRGDQVVIEVTRIRRTTADSIVIEHEASGVEIPGRPRREAPRQERPATDMVGQLFRGRVEDVGREGDGIVRVDGKVVFVEGATLGEDVEFEVVEDLGRFARGIVTRRFEGEAPVADIEEREEDEDVMAEPERRMARPDQSIAVGLMYEVLITDADRNNPETDGVARLNGLIVFVPGTQPGDRVLIRITGLQHRSARAEVVELLNP